jgi:tRNA threonylcarbamoyladenosine biosynthesis protein TsaE
MPLPPDASADEEFRAELCFPNEAETRNFAEALAPLLGAGDVLLLEGPIGAGKTAFARALIAARLAAAGAAPEDIPSPTFTLVQTYLAGPLEIWHADLYRLSHPDEAAELGLEEAFTTALCLVEWPDRLGPAAPPGALRLAFAPGAAEDTRCLTLSGPSALGARLKPVLEAADAA